MEQRWKRLRELRQQFHLAFEELKKRCAQFNLLPTSSSNPETVRTSADVDVTVVTKKGSEIHNIFTQLGAAFAGEVFIASRVTVEVSDGTKLL